LLAELAAVREGLGQPGGWAVARDAGASWCPSPSPQLSALW